MRKNFYTKNCYKYILIILISTLYFKASSIYLYKNFSRDGQRNFARGFLIQQCCHSDVDGKTFAGSRQAKERTMLPKEGTAKNQLEYTHKWS